MQPADFAPEIYAIDFGTTNSLLAAASRSGTHAALRIDPAAVDPTVFRSILCFGSDGGTWFGAEALCRYAEQGMQGRLVRSLKKHLPSTSFQETEAAGRRYKLEELVGGILRTLRERANTYFDRDVDRVLLGRPARFGTSPAEDALAEARLCEAARLAGFRDVALCPEPIAAASAFRHRLDRPRAVLIADLGGGTSDFSLIRMGPDGYRSSGVLSTGGVGVAGDALDGSLMRAQIARHLGADAQYRAPLGKNVLTMPKRLVARLYSPADMSLLSQRDVLAFLRDIRGSTLSAEDHRQLERLVILAEDALGFQVFEAIEVSKRELCESGASTFRFDYPGIEIEQGLTLEQFETASREEVTRIIEALDTTLKAGGVRPAQVEIVCVTGGSARVPRIARALRDRFSGAEFHALSSFHAVVEGLAERARKALWERGG